jgi:Peptidase S46
VQAALGNAKTAEAEFAARRSTIADLPCAFRMARFRLSQERDEGSAENHILRTLRPGRKFGFEGPSALPSRYTAGGQKLDMATPFNFVTTADIIGGNSGSPVIDRDGAIAGLIFDGNIEWLVGDYVYDDQPSGECRQA